MMPTFVFKPSSIGVAGFILFGVGSLVGRNDIGVSLQLLGILAMSGAMLWSAVSDERKRIHNRDSN